VTEYDSVRRRLAFQLYFDELLKHPEILKDPKFNELINNPVLTKLATIIFTFANLSSSITYYKLNSIRNFTQTSS
jgi:hypothetical protein